MTLIWASKKENKDRIYFNLYGNIKLINKKAKFKIGDTIRISKYKRKVFDRGYTPNWTEEIFYCYQCAKHYSENLYVETCKVKKFLESMNRNS